MKEAIYKTYYKKKGQKVVDMNNASIERGIHGLREVKIPDSWLAAQDVEKGENLPDFIREVVAPMNRQEGNSLSVGMMKKYGVRGRDMACWNIEV